jgi:hypothetical protein
MTGELKGVDGNSSEQRLRASVQEKSQVRMGEEVEGGGRGKRWMRCVEGRVECRKRRR